MNFFKLMDIRLNLIINKQKELCMKINNLYRNYFKETNRKIMIN